MNVVHRALPLALALVSAACMSYPLPPRLTPEEVQAVASTRFPLTVGVEEEPWAAEADNLLDQLRRTELFERVELLSALPDADLVARVEAYAEHADAVFGMGTVLTLGFVPTFSLERGGEVFSLRSARGTQQPLDLDFRYEGQACWGWFASFHSLRGDATLSAPRRTRRYNAALAARLVALRDEILALGGHPGDSPSPQIW